MKNILIKGLFVLVSIILTTSAASALTCTNLPKGLAKGSKSNDVLKLQQFLFDTGYLTTWPDHYFGPSTVTALKKFQGKNGFSQVGSVGPLTRSKIKELSCGKTFSQEKSISSSQKNKSDTHVIATEMTEKEKENITITINNDDLYFSKNDNGIYALKNFKQYLTSEYATKGTFLASEFEEKALDKSKINIDCNERGPQYAETSEHNILSLLKTDKDIIEIKNYYLSIKEVKDKRDAEELFKKDRTLLDSIKKHHEASEVFAFFYKKNVDSLEKEFDTLFKTKIQNSADRALSEEMSREINLCRLNKNDPLIEIDMENSSILKHEGKSDFLYFIELLLRGKI